MKKIILILLIFTIYSCKEANPKKQMDIKTKERFIADTKILKALNDSLNTSGDNQYYIKYIRKIDEMIKKYPEQNELLSVKESMIEIFGSDTSSH